MKKRKSFGVKLWLWFAVFAAAIFLVLWLLQTVFLQSFYNDMAIRGVERAAKEIVAHAGETDFTAVIDKAASENSLLVFVTDMQGNILYSADAYRRLYGGTRQAEGGTDNPYHSGDVMNWERARCAICRTAMNRSLQSSKNPTQAASALSRRTTPPM